MQYILNFVLVGLCASLHLQTQENRSLRCSDGYSLTECDFDLAGCAARAVDPSKQKWAFILAHDLSHEYVAPSPRNLKSLIDVRRQHKNIDIVLVVPGFGGGNGKGNRTLVRRDTMVADAASLGADVLEISPNGLVPPRWLTKDKYYEYHPLSVMAQERIYAAGVKIASSAFAAPPGIRQSPYEMQDPVHDMMKINAFALEGYDAAIFYDNDVELTGNGDVAQLFKCASQDYFLSTSGPLANLNAGFMAFRPSVKLATAMVSFAENNEFDMQTGWANAGITPGYSVGPNQQIFYFTFFYKSSAAINKAYDDVGVAPPKSRQLDRCVWNFLDKVGCDANWTCDEVFVIHKDSRACKHPGPAHVREISVS